MKQAYEEVTLKPDTLKLVMKMDAILTQYMADGYVLSVRQVFYQLVSRAIVANTQKEYKRVADILSKGRLQGLLDWDAIEDRNREFILRQRWDSGQHILDNTAGGYHEDMWTSQEQRVIVMVEKAALEGVLRPVCQRWDVPLLAARGYPSSTIVRELALEHMQPFIDEGQFITILHFGDHDPSGIDMTRDITERCEQFLEGSSHWLTVNRCALNMDQVEAMKPPPNPAKMTDSRVGGYIKRFGRQSWELDAIEPNALAKLATSRIEPFIDKEAWDTRHDEVEHVRAKLYKVAEDFDQPPPEWDGEERREVKE